MKEAYRIGNGIDIHPLVQDRDLVVGGIKIDHHLGSDGHSDGDALIHALIDALLGAVGLGDIGEHFPSNDPRYEGIDSVDLLKETATLLKRDGWKLVNLDATIIAEKPHLKEYVDAMSKKLAKGLSVDSSQINVKAKTNDGLGFLGAGDGIAVWAVAIVTELR